MGWNPIKKVGKLVKDVGKVINVATFGASDALGVGQAFDLAGKGVDEVTGKAHDDREKAKKAEQAALTAAEAAAKKAADDDYYRRVMAARDKQVAGYLDSQTDMTSDGESLGDYGKKLGTFGDVGLGGKKKKMYY